MATLSLPALRPGKRGLLNLFLFAGFFLSLGLVIQQRRNPDADAPRAFVRREHSLARATVQNGQGQEVPLVPFGGGVVLVVSEDCQSCQSLLRAWAKDAREEYLVHLHLVSLEGPRSASQMIALRPGEPTLRPGQTGGPAADGKRWLRSLGARQTPALLHVSPEGEMLDQKEGELSPEELRLWLRRAR